MIRVFPFRREHFELIEPDPYFADAKDVDIEPFVRSGGGSTIIDTETGEILVCVGYVLRRNRPNVYWVWMLPSRRGSLAMVAIVRFVNGWCETLAPGSRVECSVLDGFKPGLRLMKFLKFEQETPDDEPARLHDGKRDYHLFARVVPHQESRRPGRELLQDAVLLGAGCRLHAVSLGGGHDRICPL